nr:hypothetical protein [Tanacetum cinerariifolium]
MRWEFPLRRLKVVKLHEKLCQEAADDFDLDAVLAFIDDDNGPRPDVVVVMDPVGSASSYVAKAPEIEDPSHFPTLGG